MASISEISAMVRQNAENAKESRSLSESSEGATKQGMEAMNRLTHAIEEIGISNKMLKCR